MANANVHQTKLKRLVFENEATPGTKETLDADSVTIPAFDVSIDRSRGTGQITRAATLDGFAGAQANVPGSFGTNLSFSSEIHDEGAIAMPSWARLMVGCGFRAEDNGSTTTILTPSTQQIAAYSGPDYNPNSLTFGLATFIDTEDDTQQDCFGATGACTWTLNSGERAQIDFTFVAKNSGSFVEQTATSVYGDNTVTGAAISGLPLVMKGAQISITDVDVVNLQSVTINWNQETPDVVDPTEADGFGLSPVLWNEGPTVSFTVASTEANDGQFWAKFKNGQTATMSITLDEESGLGTGRSIVITFSQIQYQGVTWSDSNGYETYEIEAKVVRSTGEDYRTAGSLANVTWTYA